MKKFNIIFSYLLALALMILSVIFANHDKYIEAIYNILLAIFLLILNFNQEEK